MDTEPLTPPHFLIGRESVFSQALSKSDSIVSSSEMNKLFEARSFFIDKFLVIWSDDYIRHLPPCTRQGCKRDDLRWRNANRTF